MAILLCAAIAFAMGVRCHLQRRHGVALGWLLVGSLCLRVYPALDGYLHAWDERYHALVARNLLAHPWRPTLYETPLLPYDYRDWTANHVWLHKPPLALWLMAAAMKALGPHELALRIPSLLLSVATTFAVYLIGRAWQGEAVGLIAGFFHAVNAFMVLLAAGWYATDHVDTAVVAFVALSVAAGVTLRPDFRAFAISGALAGLAVLAKSWLGLLPLSVLLVWHGQHMGTRRLPARLALAVCVCLVVAMPWWVYSARAFPLEAAWERSYTWRHLFESLEGHGGSPLFHIGKLPKIYGELIYLPLLWLGVRLARGVDARGWALATWILVPYGIFSLAATKMPAYVMIAAPAVFVVQAAFCVQLARYVDGSLARRCVLGAVLAAVAGLPVRILLNDLRIFREHDRYPTWAAELRELGARLGGQQAVIFGSERPIETMFYTSRTAYAEVPDLATLQGLQARGYLVVVYRVPKLAEDVGRLPGVLLLDP